MLIRSRLNEISALPLSPQIEFHPESKKMTPIETTVAAVQRSRSDINDPAVKPMTTQELFKELSAQSDSPIVKEKPRFPTLTESDNTYRRLRTAIRAKFSSLVERKDTIFVTTEDVRIDFFNKFIAAIAEQDKQHYNCLCCRSFFSAARNYGYLDQNDMSTKNILKEVFIEEGILPQFEGGDRFANIMDYAPVEVTTETRNSWDHFFAFTPAEVEVLNKRGDPDYNFVAAMTATLSNQAMKPETVRAVHESLSKSLYKPETIGLLIPLADFLERVKASRMSIGTALKLAHREANFSWLYSIMASNAGNVIKFICGNPTDDRYKELISLINHNTDPERYKKAQREASIAALKRDVDKLAELGVPRLLERQQAMKEDLNVVWSPSVLVKDTEPTAKDATTAALEAILKRKEAAPQDNILSIVSKETGGVKDISLRAFLSKLPEFSKIWLKQSHAQPVMFTKPVDDADYTSVFVDGNEKISYRTTTRPVPVSVFKVGPGGKIAADYIIKFDDMSYVIATETSREYLDKLCDENGTIILGTDFKPEFKSESRAWTQLSKDLQLVRNEGYFTGIAIQTNGRFVTQSSMGIETEYHITSRE